MFARLAPRAAARTARARIGRAIDWIAAAFRRARSRTSPADSAPVPGDARSDHEKVARVGEVLQSCFPEVEETLDIGLTTLMLHLAVEPAESPAPRKR